MLYSPHPSAPPLLVQSPLPRSAWIRRSALAGARVLLVEDNPINLELLQELLRLAGVQVTTASNGREAIALLDLAQRRREAFDAVLMDCQMPVLDGFAATRAIRAQARFAALPIIAMTASAMASDRRKALEAGMDDHIVKPIEAKAMRDALVRWIAPARAGTPVKAGTRPADR